MKARHQRKTRIDQFTVSLYVLTGLLLLGFAVSKLLARSF